MGFKPHVAFSIDCPEPGCGAKAEWFCNDQIGQPAFHESRTKAAIAAREAGDD